MKPPRKTDESAVRKALDLLLERAYWIPSLKAGVQYTRHEDDSQDGFLSVVISMDGDGWIEVLPPKEECRLSLRFRTPMFGGGMSPRVHMAMRILAEAIRRDNEEEEKRKGKFQHEEKDSKKTAPEEA